MTTNITNLLLRFINGISKGVLLPGGQRVRKGGKHDRPILANNNRILNPDAPPVGVKPAVTDGYDHIGGKGRRLFLSVEKSVTRGQRRLFKIDPDTVNRRAKNVLSMASIPHNSVHCFP